MQKQDLESTFAFLTKNLKGILVIVGAILGLKLLATLVAIVKVGAGILAILANPLLIAGIGILIVAGMQGLGKGEKEVLKELESMGGYSKENRDKLIAKLQEQKKNLSPLEIIQGVGKEIDARILFLEEGLYGQGLSKENKKEFDWSSIEDADTLSGYENFMLNFETDKTNMNNNKDLVKDNNNKITKIEIEGETVDLRQNNKKQFNESPSETSATNVGSCKSSR